MDLPCILLVSQRTKNNTIYTNTRKEESSLIWRQYVLQKKRLNEGRTLRESVEILEFPLKDGLRGIEIIKKYFLLE